MLVLSKLSVASSITPLAATHFNMCPSSTQSWKAQEGANRYACAAKKSKTTVLGQGRHVLFPHEEEVVQWVKDTRREDFPLKASHMG